MQKLYTKYSAQGFRMVAINVIPEQDAMVPEWAKKGGYTFPILVGANTNQIVSNYNVTATPATFLLDPKGKILQRIDGFTPGELGGIERQIQSAIGASGAGKTPPTAG